MIYVLSFDDKEMEAVRTALNNTVNEYPHSRLTETIEHLRSYYPTLKPGYKP